MASSLAMLVASPLTTRAPPPPRNWKWNGHVRISSITCKAKDAEAGGGGIELAAAVGGMLANPVIGVSLYVLRTTGCGLPPGPGGTIGAAEGVSYLLVAGIVGWSLYTKVRTGSGLPAGPYGLLGAVEGLSYLTVLAIVVVFGLQFLDKGSLPGPLPGDQCFG